MKKDFKIKYILLDQYIKKNYIILEKPKRRMPDLGSILIDLRYRLFGTKEFFHPFDGYDDSDDSIVEKKECVTTHHKKAKEYMNKLIGLEEDDEDYEITQEEIERERRRINLINEEEKYRKLNELIDKRIKGENFHDYLTKIIIKKDFSNQRIYSGANIGRKQFSRIICDKEYTPRKDTIIALAISLEQNIEGINVMLSKAGYTLTDTSKLDIIVKYYIERGIFDIDIINEALLYFKIPLLGSKERE